MLMLPRRHVDLRAQRARAIGELAGAHAAEKVEVLIDAARRGTASCGPGSVSVPRYSRTSSAERSQTNALPSRMSFSRAQVQHFEIVRRVAQVVPFEAEPAHVVLDRVDVFLLFPGRVGVVEAQVAVAAEFAREAEVQADRLGMAEVQVAVRLRRKPRRHASAVLSGGAVVDDDLADEMILCGVGHQGWPPVGDLTSK